MPLGSATASNKTRTSCEVTKWLTALCHLTWSRQTVWKGTSEDYTAFGEDKHEYLDVFLTMHHDVDLFQLPT